MSGTIRRLAILVILLLTGCASSTLHRTRAHLSRGDVAGAVASAGSRWAALREVSLAVLEESLSRPETSDRAIRAVLRAGEPALPLARRLFADGDALASTVGAALLVELDTVEASAARALLLERIHQDDAVLRAVAVGALGPRDGGQEHILPLLGDPSELVRMATIEALGGSRNDPLVRIQLIDLIRHDPSDAIRGRALRALERCEDTSEVVTLAEAALASDTLSLRLVAVNLLAARIDDPLAEALLRAVLDSDDEAVATRAAVALAAGGDDDALERLTAAIGRGSAAVALVAAIGAAQVGPELAAALTTALERPSPEVRLRAAASLRALGHSEAADQTLVNLLVEPSWVGTQAALLLARSGDTPALERLALAMGDLDPSHRAFVAATCLAVPTGLELARQGLADRSALVRLAAATSVLRLVSREG